VLLEKLSSLFIREVVQQVLAAIDPESVSLRRKHRLVRRNYRSRVYKTYHLLYVACEFVCTCMNFRGQTSAGIWMETTNWRHMDFPSMAA